MSGGQFTSAPDLSSPEEIAQSVSDLASQEADCRRFFSERHPTSIALMEDAFDIYLDALHLCAGHGWKSYSEQAVILWSFLTFHTARAAFLLALTGYLPQVMVLVRALADQANLCVLFKERTEYAEKALRGDKVPDAKQILRILDEGPWPGYEILHAYVHARAEAVSSYIQPTPPDEMKLALGPHEDSERFDDAVADISLFLLLATQTLGLIWRPLQQNEAWWEEFKSLRDRSLALVEERYGRAS